MNIEHLKRTSIDRPEVMTSFGIPEEFDNLPHQHKDQIFFLDKDGSDLLSDFLEYSKMVDGLNTFGYDRKTWKPFPDGYFKTVDEFTKFDAHNELKKWLYKRSLPFKTEVFILPSSGDNFILTTWKMVVKYSKKIFFHEDTIVFDKTINWALFFFHSDHIYFGYNNIYDPEIGYEKMRKLNEIKHKYPNIDFPY